MRSHSARWTPGVRYPGRLPEVATPATTVTSMPLHSGVPSSHGQVAHVWAITGKARRDARARPRSGHAERGTVRADGACRCHSRCSPPCVRRAPAVAGPWCAWRRAVKMTVPPSAGKRQSIFWVFLSRSPDRPVRSPDGEGPRPSRPRRGRARRRRTWSAWPAPMPLIAQQRRSVSPGLVSAIACRVRSVNTTYAGTFSSAGALDPPLPQPLEQLLVVRRGAVLAAADLALRGRAQRPAALAAVRHALALAPAGALLGRGLVRGDSGPQPGQEARRLARGPAAGVARQGPGDRSRRAGAGHADVEQPALLLDRGRSLGVDDRHGALVHAGQEDRVPLQALGGVQGGQRDALGDRGVLLGGPAVEVARRSRASPASGARRPGAPRPARPAPAATPSGRGRCPARSGAWSCQPMPREHGADVAATRSSPARLTAAGAAAQQRDGLADLGPLEEAGRPADDVGHARAARAPPRTPRTGR